MVDEFSYLVEGRNFLTANFGGATWRKIFRRRIRSLLVRGRGNLPRQRQAVVRGCAIEQSKR